MAVKVCDECGAEESEELTIKVFSDGTKICFNCLNYTLNFAEVQTNLFKQ